WVSGDEECLRRWGFVKGFEKLSEIRRRGVGFCVGGGLVMEVWVLDK
ncbi:hypothetical protein A2U01_0029047, partial [Trifolium medium]|nr:hypothetical protein [Trifolium medium]